MGKVLLSVEQIYINIFLGSIWNIPYISTYGVSFNPLICGYNSLKSFDGGWNELFRILSLTAHCKKGEKIEDYEYNNLSCLIHCKY